MATLRIIVTPAEQLRAKDAEIAALIQRLQLLEAEASKADSARKSAVEQAAATAEQAVAATVERLEAELVAAQAGAKAARTAAGEREEDLQARCWLSIQVLVFVQVAS
jgi:hypothetical protein